MVALQVFASDSGQPAARPAKERMTTEDLIMLRLKMERKSEGTDDDAIKAGTNCADVCECSDDGEGKVASPDAGAGVKDA